MPLGVLSGEDAGPSTSNMSQTQPSPGPQFIPGELLHIKSTMEDGGYESETQEKGAKDAPNAMVSLKQPFPNDWLFLTGQYPRGTFTDVTRSGEHGRDDWQVNHFRRYDKRAKEQQTVKSFPSV